MNYEILDEQGIVVTTIVADESFMHAQYPGGAWRAAAEQPAPPADACAWLIDIGPFFDRFGAAKLAVLSSADATVRAIVKDSQVRKWIDLQHPAVALGIDALIALAVPGVDAALKAAILETPVAPAEQSALRKVYFS